MAVAFDVAVDRSDGAIVAGWRDEAGVAHVEVVDTRPAAGWIPARMLEVVDTWRPVGIGFDAAGPALDVADALARTGLELEGLKARDYAAACAQLLEGLCDGRVRYRPHPMLDEAAASATRRALGDAWAWGRRQTSTSLATLTAATVALWTFDHAPAASVPFRIY